MVEPMSALFWWSAWTMVMGLPRTALPMSSAAICAARTEPAPPMSLNWPDSSVSTPILTMSPEIWACAAGAAATQAASAAAVAANRMECMGEVLPVVFFYCFSSSTRGRQDAAGHRAEADAVAVALAPAGDGHVVAVLQERALAA